MTLKADELGRLTCPELFPPTAVFEVVKQYDGGIQLQRVPHKQAKLVKPIRTKEGFLMLPVEISSAEAAASIRVDRDAQ